MADTTKELWENSPFGENSIFHPSWEDKQQRERLKRQQSLATTPSASGKVYLTFDDGLQLGTKDVLAVLDEANVKGTFFLTGIHVKNFIEKTDRKEGLALLKHIYLHHYIGNHSYSHANDFYKRFYGEGLKIGKKAGGDFIFRTVLEDFQLNDQILNKYLNQAGIRIRADYQHKFARFPGRDTWKTTSITDLYPGTEEEAIELYKADYLLFGWDVEWKMKFQLAEMSRITVDKKENAGTLDWNDEKETHPFYDLCKKDLVEKDRLTGTWAGISEDIEDYMHHSSWQPLDDKSKTSEKVVLLMHERAFRQCGDKYKSEAQKLALLISSLKKKGFSFDTINNY